MALKLLKNIFKKNKSSLLILNDDCIRQVLGCMSREDLAAVCCIRNVSIKEKGESIFRKKFSRGNFDVSKNGLKTETATRNAFGHLVKKMAIQFQWKEVVSVLGFVKGHFEQLEDLEVRVLPDSTDGIAVRMLHWVHKKLAARFPKLLMTVERAFELFLLSLPERYPKLKHLKFDCRVPGFDFKNVPFTLLARLESIAIVGQVQFVDVFDVQYTLAQTELIMWHREQIYGGYLLIKGE